MRVLKTPMHNRIDNFLHGNAFDSPTKFIFNNLPFEAGIY